MNKNIGNRYKGITSIYTQLIKSTQMSVHIVLMTQLDAMHDLWHIHWLSGSLLVHNTICNAGGVGQGCVYVCIQMDLVCASAVS